MDVYVATSGTVRLMDFNPVGGSTAPLLFDWDELGYGKQMLQMSEQSLGLTHVIPACYSISPSWYLVSILHTIPNR